MRQLNSFIVPVVGAILIALPALGQADDDPQIFPTGTITVSLVDRSTGVLRPLATVGGGASVEVQERILDTDTLIVTIDLLDGSWLQTEDEDDDAPAADPCEGFEADEVPYFVEISSINLTDVESGAGGVCAGGQVSIANATREFLGAELQTCVSSLTPGVTPPPSLDDIDPVTETFSVSFSPLLGPCLDILGGNTIATSFARVAVEFSFSDEAAPSPDKPAVSAFVTFRVGSDPVANTSNPRPFADAGPDQIIARDTTATLDGSRTFDAFNFGFDSTDEEVFFRDVLRYTWEFVSGPTEVQPVQETQASPFATISPSTAGLYVYRLSVIDGVNAEVSRDTVLIQVVDELPENRPPFADIFGPLTPVPFGSIVQLSAAGSVDPDGDPLIYLWQQIDELGNVLNASNAPQSFLPLSGVNEVDLSFQALGVGTFFFRLIVDDGTSIDSEDFAITITTETTAGDQDSQTGASIDDDSNSEAATDSDAQSVDAEPADSGEGDEFGTVAPVAACGFGLLPLMLLPVAMWMMKRRHR